MVRDCTIGRWSPNLYVALKMELSADRSINKVEGEAAGAQVQSSH